jgi:signal transduction histidine kinase
MVSGAQRWWETWSRRDSAVAVLVFALSLALLVPSHRNPDQGGGPLWAVVTLTAASSLPLAVRRRSPLGVFVFTAAASAVLRLIFVPTGPPLGPTVALYFLAADGDRSRPRGRVIFALAALAVLAHAAAMEINGSAPVLGALGFGIVVWSAAWLAGERARLRREKLGELEQRATQLQQDAERDRRLAVAEERARIARDLHDSAGHALNVILVHAGLGRVQSASTETREVFRVIEDVARQTVTEIDQLVGALRDSRAQPDVEPPPGLAALPALLHRHQAAGLEVATRLHGPKRSVPPAVDRTAYRILQEALTNAARHGDGHVDVELTFDDDALLVRVDNGVGTAHGNGGGHGLIGIRERAGLLGGTVHAGADDGRFRLDVRLPFARHE